MKKLFWLSLVALLMLGAATGCAALKKPEVDKPGQPAVHPETPASSGEKAIVNLYFGDDQVFNVVPERREVVKGSGQLALAVVEELIKGPQDPTLRSSLPKETKVLSVDLKEGILYVNFSREVQTKHPGGSAGESVTLDSLVYTLTELPGVEKVQVLVEGEKQETLAGHMDIIRPLERRIRLENVYISPERVKRLQQLVDAGKETWRKDPLEVARREGGMAGFLSTDKFELLSTMETGPGSGTGEAMVRAEHKGKKYLIELIQPGGPDKNQVWHINSVRKAE